MQTLILMLFVALKLVSESFNYYFSHPCRTDNCGYLSKQYHCVTLGECVNYLWGQMQSNCCQWGLPLRRDKWLEESLPTPSFPFSLKHFCRERDLGTGWDLSLPCLLPVNSCGLVLAVGCRELAGRHFVLNLTLISLCSDLFCTVCFKLQLWI